MIRVVLPPHLRVLIRRDDDLYLDVSDASPQTVLDALERQYPMLSGTIRDQVTLRRRPYVRYFACGTDISHVPADAPLPEAVQHGREPFLVVGAISGG